MTKYRNYQTKKRKIHNNKRKTKSNFTKMSCSPAVKDMTPVRDSCLTQEVLFQLKKSYNASHSSNPIYSNSPDRIWSSLRQRMRTCNKEDCWLDLIKDDNVRRTMDKYLFAPDQPVSWKNNPYTWLNTDDIYKVLRQYEDKYPNFGVIRPSAIDFDKKIGGVTSDECVTDELCRFDVVQQLEAGKTKVGIVFNLDKHDEPGSHWVSLFVDLDDNYAYYMDSAGDSVPMEIMKLVERIQQQCSRMNKTITFHENHPMQHQYGNTECGVYSLFFIITMLTGQTDLHKFVDLNEKLDFFKSKRIPDKYISKFREIYFNA